MRVLNLLILGLMVTAAGCATTRKNDQTDNCKSQLAAVSNKFEVAKKENLNLKKEITLFRVSRGVDSHRFMKALGGFEKDLTKEISHSDVSLQITDRGLVITILAEKLFVSGTDSLSDVGKELLGRIDAGLQAQFPTNYIYIDGHTDNQSLAVFEWKSDWDFSFARALSVLKYFTENKGMNPLRLSASGFGQYRPRASNDTKGGRRMNRRIDIIISPQRLKHVVYD